MNTLIRKLKENLSEGKLPGTEAQFSMAPATRQDELNRRQGKEKPRQSAVLILFYNDGPDSMMVFIKRPTDESVHSGQVAFPGGRMEKSDRDHVHTALREAQEEVNVDPAAVTILGSLSKLHIPPSNFDVIPVVGYTPTRPAFRGNEEVDKIIEVSVDHLLNPTTKTSRVIRHRLGKQIEVPCFIVDGEIIWGATAMILGELLDIIGPSRKP